MNQDNQKINVRLYGGKGIFGGKETPLEADEIFCDMHERCSYWKEGKCLRCRTMFQPVCKYGCTSTAKGYTSRAAKYYQFKNKYKEDSMYNKLSFPNKKIAVIGEYLFIAVPIRITKTEKGIGYWLSDPGFGTNGDFIPLSDVTPELLARILKFRPDSLMGGEITSYQEKTVPELVRHLKTLLPDMASALFEKYPELNMKPVFIGKKAYVSTLKPGTVFYIKNVKYTFDGECIQSEEHDIGLGSPFWPGRATIGTVRVKITEDTTVEITEANESIVDEDTKFDE